jgi:serine/threonine-protein kinase HipA
MIAEVQLWGRTIGAVSLDAGREVAAFQYDAEFAKSGTEISPLVMPLVERIYGFPALPRGTFHGLPGLMADSLPDKFGNALIDALLATQGRTPDSFGAVERLCYPGSRGMGALKFAPALGPKQRTTSPVAIDEQVRLASEVLTHRNNLQGHFHEVGKARALRDILQAGTSAGGARAKAVIARNPATNEVRSGQIAAAEGTVGFEYWLLKFNGVSGNKDKELDDPTGYGSIEYAYDLMAKAAGITMSECRLLEENGRRHFMARRFDRLAGGEKLHMQRCARWRISMSIRPARRVFVRTGAADNSPAQLADGGGGGAVPAHAVQHRRAQSGRPCEEHRVSDEQAGRLGAGTGV